MTIYKYAWIGFGNHVHLCYRAGYDRDSESTLPVSFSGKEETHVEDIEDDDGNDHHSSI
jgi:hypothetical protein